MSSWKSARLFVAGMAISIAPTFADAAELNALVWCDHADPRLLQPFEEANGVRVNVKEYEGTGAGLAIVDQSRPGDWDVMVIDSVDVRRGVARDLFAPLPEDKLPFDDLFAGVVLDNYTKIDGVRYSITEKFGYDSISYDTRTVESGAIASFDDVLDGAYKDRLAIYDYYLPLIGMAALSIGKATADLTADDLPAIREKLLALKANAKLVAEVVGSQAALATGEVDVLVGAGEWVTASMASENPHLEFVIPNEGGILWSQSLAIFKDSPNKDLALKFIQYVMSPEGQARLATSSCFWGVPANKKAALTAEQKTLIRFDQQEDFLARAQLYPAPDADLDKKMQDLWTDVLQAQ